MCYVDNGSDSYWSITFSLATWLWILRETNGCMISTMCLICLCFQRTIYCAVIVHLNVKLDLTWSKDYVSSGYHTAYKDSDIHEYLSIWPSDHLFLLFDYLTIRPKCLTVWLSEHLTTRSCFLTIWLFYLTVWVLHPRGRLFLERHLKFLKSISIQIRLVCK